MLFNETMVFLLITTYTIIEHNYIVMFMVSVIIMALFGNINGDTYGLFY